MPLIILKWKNRLEKLRKIGAEFTKMVRRICKLCAQNFEFLPQNSEIPTISYGQFQFLMMDNTVCCLCVRNIPSVVSCWTVMAVVVVCFYLSLSNLTFVMLRAPASMNYIISRYRLSDEDTCVCPLLVVST